MGVAAAAVVAIGTAAYSENRSSAREDDVKKAEKKRQGEEASQRAGKASRERRKQIQRGMRARAQQENQAASQGTQGGTTAIQASAGASSQVGANITGVNTQVSNKVSMEGHNQNVLDAQRKRAGIGEQLSTQIGGTVLNKGANALGESIFN